MEKQSTRVGEEMPLIKLEKSIIPACDVGSLGKLAQLVKATCDIEGIGAYKVGFELAIPFGLRSVVDKIRRLTHLPIIYDHQKAGTDIPDTGAKFMSACKEAGVDAVIIFPQAGPETEKAWIDAAREKKLGIIVGGEMTHKAYLETDNGFISANAPKRMYEIAAKKGVTDFVVPGNRPNKIKEYAELLKRMGVKATFYSPGFVAQGGRISDSAKICERWHAIVGRAIYNTKDMRKAAKGLAREIASY
jgi:orotidine-5'-phosphate decarboxylase